MRSLINSVKDLSLKAKHSPCHRSFLDGTITDPGCQSMTSRMTALTPECLGVECLGECPYHFKGNLNRVMVDEGSEDYKLVLFFIKKGTRMPLHDHPNMSVFFRLVFGSLDYRSYDKVDEKFKYNDFSCAEYEEMIESRQRVMAKKSKPMKLKTDDLLFVRPSTNNMHEFVATENSCFFDICLPNYTPTDASRALTFYKEIDANNPATLMRGGLTELEYYTTQHTLPTDMVVNDVDYRGELM